MSTFGKLVSRGSQVLAQREDDQSDGDSVMNLMLTFLGVVFVALLLAVGLLTLRRVKRRRVVEEEALPQWNNQVKRFGRNHNRLTIQTSDGRSSVLLVNGRPMLADPEAPPYSPTNIPEIHITFPDEQDEFGQQKSGRVVVVRVGEKGVGLEPLKEEELPAYEDSKDGFYSINMDDIGGLKEKDRTQSQ